MNPAPLVTVLVTTYNQEKYISSALDSILAQQVSFPYEILVSEDHGKDGTVPLFLRSATFSLTARLCRNIFRDASPAQKAYVTANRSHSAGRCTSLLAARLHKSLGRRLCHQIS